MRPLSLFQLSLFRRFLTLAILFVLELVVITTWLDGEALRGRGGFLALAGSLGAWVLRFVVASAVLFVTFAFLQMSAVARDGLRQVSQRLAEERFAEPVWIAAHAGMLALFALLARTLFESPVNGALGTWIAISWLTTGIAAVLAGLCALIPWRFWRQLPGLSGKICGPDALATSAGACVLGAYARNLWSSAAAWTYALVKGMLSLFLPGVFTNLSTMSILTPTLPCGDRARMFGTGRRGSDPRVLHLWLWLFRREFRFPHALLMAPVSVAVLFLLNAVRIVVLILIGNAGAPDIATGGFHSQAGWIAFNLVAIVLMVAARRVHWITVSHSGAAAFGGNGGQAEPAIEENPAAPYLVPFLLILAAAMISRAASGGFEWLYPLRLLASGAALWVYRARYRKLDWRFGWEAPVVGTLVFALWLGGDWLTGNHPHNPLIPNATMWMATAQGVWLLLRILSSTLTVPIAEELAFRGYLIRRIISARF